MPKSYPQDCPSAEVEGCSQMHNKHGDVKSCIRHCERQPQHIESERVPLSYESTVPPTQESPLDHLLGWCSPEYNQEGTHPIQSVSVTSKHHLPPGNLNSGGPIQLKYHKASLRQISKGSTPAYGGSAKLLCNNVGIGENPPGSTPTKGCSETTWKPTPSQQYSRMPTNEAAADSSFSPDQIIHRHHHPRTIANLAVIHTPGTAGIPPFGNPGREEEAQNHGVAFTRTQPIHAKIWYQFLRRVYQDSQASNTAAPLHIKVESTSMTLHKMAAMATQALQHVTFNFLLLSQADGAQKICEAIEDASKILDFDIVVVANFCSLCANRLNESINIGKVKQRFLVYEPVFRELCKCNVTGSTTVGSSALPVVYVILNRVVRIC
ncbi:hypothetical protein PR048_004759 [Dryococelus australis]|uniref:Uncharacterized protein n=1 Tax=Dryococelus australis TaxID=614101 RepID=A0ABQ9I7D9_9NEOP|nr:hypothetical protein PR048_004759 [Dryococelus australis]